MEEPVNITVLILFLKDLQLSSHEDVQMMIIREPYSTFLHETENSMKKYEEMRDERLERLNSLRQKVLFCL